MGIPYYLSQGLHGVDEYLTEKRQQKAKTAEAEQALQSKMLGYKFLLDQQKQAQESRNQSDLERSRRDALLEAVKGGDLTAGRRYDELLGFQPELPRSEQGVFPKAQDRGTLPDVLAQGEMSPAAAGAMEGYARRVLAKTTGEAERKQADLDLEREYKEQQMAESKSRIAENYANIGKIKAQTTKATNKADLKDNISTIKIALDTMNKEEKVLATERDKILAINRGRVPPEMMPRMQQIERRIAEIGEERALKSRRLDSLREGFEVPPIKSGKLAGAHESYWLISQMIGRRAGAPELAKKLVQDGRSKSIIEANAKAKEYITIRDAAKEYLKKPGKDKPIYSDDDDLEALVDQFLADNPDATEKALREAL